MHWFQVYEWRRSQQLPRKTSGYNPGDYTLHQGAPDAPVRPSGHGCSDVEAGRITKIVLHPKSLRGDTKQSSGAGPCGPPWPTPRPRPAAVEERSWGTMLNILLLYIFIVRSLISFNYWTVNIIYIFFQREICWGIWKNFQIKDTPHPIVHQVQPWSDINKSNYKNNSNTKNAYLITIYFANID